jgi:Fic family protein
MSERRDYETSHPWLTFKLDASRIPAPVWILLGEARSKCEHLAGVPLQPATAKSLSQVFLVKGVRATTAIEGNTLSEEQIRAQVEGTLKLPPSKQYQAQEVQNILDAYNSLWKELADGTPVTLTVERILQWNAMVLRNLETAPEVQPGQVSAHSVGVMGYRGAPAKDCAYLLGQLVEWLNTPAFQPAPEYAVIQPILAAIMAHLYLAWIHPFGDGNGRTARLVEFTILVLGGVPMPAAHLLSNHYNETRSEYYRQLDMASRTGGDVIPFIRYAVQGLVDGLRDQINVVRSQQVNVAWTSYIHERMRGAGGGAAIVKRRRDLILEMSNHPQREQPRTLEEISLLSPTMAKIYADRTHKTLRRDINELKNLGLVIASEPGRWKPNVDIIAAFLPARHVPAMPTPEIRRE